MHCRKMASCKGGTGVRWWRMGEGMRGKDVGVGVREEREGWGVGVVEATRMLFIIV